MRSMSTRAVVPGGWRVMPDPSTIREATSLAETTTGTTAGAGSSGSSGS